MIENNLIPISGAGKGGGGSIPIEEKNTLQSKQTLRLLFAISEGIIESLDVANDVYLNGVKASEYDAETLSITWRNGALDQTLIPGFSDVESPFTGAGTFPKQLLQNVQNTFTIPFSYDAVRITMGTPTMREVDDNGNRKGTRVEHDIFVRHQGLNQTPGTWTLVTHDFVKGKCTSPYAWDIRVEKPDITDVGDSWGIMVVRTSPDDANNDRRERDTFINQITTIVDARKTYPGTALVGVTIKDAKRFNGNIPEIIFRPKGIKVKIPNNYNPVLRTYNETTPWNGGFATNNAYTDNLSWVIFDVLTSSKCLGISQSDVDIGSFYTYSKICDALVSNGEGGTEPRYRIDHMFIDRENVATFLTYLFNLGNCQLTPNLFGQIAIIYDAPGQAIKHLVTNSNVENGEFSYHSNDLETRFNFVTATIKDELLKGETETPFAEDNILIERYSLQQTDIPLPGCIRQSQAIRKCRWAIWVNSYATELVSFSQLFAGAVKQVGDLIEIMDSDNVSDVDFHASVMSASVLGNGNTSIILNKAIPLKNETYTIHFIRADGSTSVPKTIFQKNASVSSVSFAGSDLPIIGSPVIFSSISLKPKVFKILKKTYDNNKYTFLCQIHHESKYNYIEQGYSLVPKGKDFTDFNKFSAEAPVNIAIKEVFSSTATTHSRKLEISWQWDLNNSEKYMPSFMVSWSVDDDNYEIQEKVTSNTFDIQNPIPGVYEIFVWAINPFSGFKSIPATLVYNYRTGNIASSLLPPVNARVEGTAGLIFSQATLTLVFDYNTGNDAVAISDRLFDYVLEVWDASNVTLKKSYFIKPDTNKNGTFVLSFAENVSVFGTPTRAFSIKLYSRDAIGDRSTALICAISNPTPTLTGWSITPDVNGVLVKITPSTELDVKNYIIYRSQTANFTKNDTTLIYEGPDTQILLDTPSPIAYYYAISIIDSFGKAGANISTEQSAVSLSFDTDSYVYTGLTFKPNDPSTNKVTWTAAVATRNGTTSWNISANTVGATWTTGIMYIYYVPGTTSLQTTTSLTAAIGAGGRILATYKGGTDLTADAGRAFTSGDMILAGTVAAAQLVTNTAVITGAAQIASAIITQAKMANASVGTAQIIDANITTLKVAGAAITANEFVVKTSTFTPTSISTVDSATTTYTVPGLTLVPTTVDLAINRLIQVSFYISNTDTTCGWIEVQLLNNGSSTGLPNPKAIDIPTRQVAGSNISHHTFMFNHTLTAGQTCSYTLRLIIANGTTNKWDNTNPPIFGDFLMITLSGKR